MLSLSKMNTGRLAATVNHDASWYVSIIAPIGMDEEIVREIERSTGAMETICAIRDKKVQDYSIEIDILSKMIQSKELLFVPHKGEPLSGVVPCDDGFCYLMSDIDAMLEAIEGDRCYV